MELMQLGWHPFFEACFNEYKEQGFVPGRIARENRGNYLILTERGEFIAEVSGKFRHEADARDKFPAVGDWVVVKYQDTADRAIIHRVLPRRTMISRKAVLSGGMPDTGGRTDEQVLAANIDIVFLVGGLDYEFNLRRLERYLTVVWDSGAIPYIILNKIDLVDNPEEYIRETESISPGVSIFPISALCEADIDTIREQLGVGQTAVFLGSSGVGKSTIINALIGEKRQATTEVREHDSRGRHTTTNRELILLPDGSLVIDTPGLREIQAFADYEGMSRTFEDIEELAAQCRFNDCSHNREPGCAISTAIENGELDEGRLANYRKMKKELAYLALRKDKRAEIVEREKWKTMQKNQNTRNKIRRKGIY